jgi:hypothetical protein
MKCTNRVPEPQVGRTKAWGGKEETSHLRRDPVHGIIGHSNVVWEHAVTGSAAVVTDIDNASWCLESGLTLNLGNDCCRDDEANQIFRIMHVLGWFSDHISN